MYLCLTLDGLHNITLAKRLSAGGCFKGIMEGNKRLAYLEVVLGYGTQGYSMSKVKGGLIDVYSVRLEDFDKVLAALRAMGFTGLVGVTHDDAYNNEQWFDGSWCVFTKL